MSPLATVTPSLRLYDADLPMLAAQAAIELDSLRRGRSIGLKTVSDIGQRLRSSVDISHDSGRRAVLDSGAFAIVGQALDSSEWSGRLKTTNQLINETAEIAEAMNNLDDAADPGLIEKIRNFCVALSRYAAAYRQSLHDLAPADSFRR
jgi:hypothetical protein